MTIKGSEEAHMNKKLLYLLVLLATLMLVAACGGSSENEGSVAEAADEHEDEHMDDHGAQHIHADPPEEFVSLTNPEAGHDDALAAGQELYTTNCLTCHGPEGKGDGEGAVNLDPKPANLSDGVMMADLNDGYLFWRISKGGAFEPFNSAMPAWEQSFTEDQRWQLVTYVRSLSGHDHMDEDQHMEEDSHEEGTHEEDTHEEDTHEEGEHQEGEDQHEGEEQHTEEGEHEETDQHDE
jgi:mono/diheme cytochrome c family protein